MILQLHVSASTAIYSERKYSERNWRGFCRGEMMLTAAQTDHCRSRQHLSCDTSPCESLFLLSPFPLVLNIICNKNGLRENK
ncbi:hypothetical protein SLEP1_g20249 [Rubroshorea leprosula]|uniref:Uncharacterized protein n=1 Tax=Rubroshorea leprosula TaxID=152421 RepID=A0AAV5J9M5_9ROSI|nr:hypothetical protein SLEP1_g20249 [Rubroshorea leprosula]